MIPDLDDLEQPLQPLGWSDRVMRFKPNAIVVRLLENCQERRIDMNTVRMWVASGEISVDDLVHFVQLLGYSVSSMGDLDYVPRDKLVQIDQAADAVWRRRMEACDGKQ